MSGSRKARACRICFDAKCETYVEVDSELIQLFEYCIGVSLSSSTDHRVFCSKCAKTLQNYAEFKKRCLTAHNLWENMLSEVKCYSESIKPEIELKEEILEEYLTDNYDRDGFFNDEYSVEPKDDVDAKELIEFNVADVKAETVKKIGIKKRKLKKERKPVKKKRRKIVKTENNELDKEYTEQEFLKQFFGRLKPIKQNKKFKEWCCIRCGKQYKTKKNLPQHIKLCYGLKNISIKDSNILKMLSPLFHCGLCEFSSENRTIVMDHLNEKCLTELTCKLCDFTGRDVADMVSHRYVHHSPEFRHTYYCPLCGKNFWVCLKAEFHYRTEHLNKKKGGWCSTCDHVFGVYKSYRNHLRLHKNARYICDLCGMKFLFRNSIKEHLMVHYNITTCICDTCGKRFKKRDGLKSHIRNIHTVSTPVICTHCNRTFKGQRYLDKHLKIVNQAKNFICDVCSKAYSSAGSLERHMIWHTDERPFACPSCDSKYKAKSQLTIHMRSHTGSKPFKCHLCDMAFPSGPQLKRHMSVHTGIRSVKCLHCDRTFHSKALMFDHCKSKHGIIVKPEKPVQLTNCKKSNESHI